MSKKKREIPKWDLPIIETHCHLDYLKDRPLEETLQLSIDHGVEKILTISVEPKNLAVVRDLSSSHEMIYGTQGIHPHEAKDFNEEVEKEIREHAKDKKILAIGEIGLDFHYNHSPREVQIEAFKSQMQIAIDLDMPVVIHSREADPETIAVLEEFGPKLNKKGVIHSFTSGKELAEKALELGFYLGFNGIITFKNAQNVRDIVDICPVEKALIETDAPFLTPSPYRGRENAPFYLPFVVEQIAKQKGLSDTEALMQFNQNAIKLFQF